jgi:hypothetical protein
VLGETVLDGREVDRLFQQLLAGPMDGPDLHCRFCMLEDRPH